MPCSRKAQRSTASPWTPVISTASLPTNVAPNALKDALATSGPTSTSPLLKGLDYLSHWPAELCKRPLPLDSKTIGKGSPRGSDKLHADLSRRDPELREA